MSQATILAQARPMKTDALTVTLDRFAAAVATDIPGHEWHWAKAVGGALAHVERALREHQALAKDPDGLLAGVDETRPTLARQADGLRSDHTHLLKQVVALREEVQRAMDAFGPASALSPKTGVGRSMDFGAIREEAKQLLASLQHTKDAEMQLVFESVNTDIGGGD
jgi:hypothetical protein